jgi:pilus assembly protein Flp/PilA
MDFGRSTVVVACGLFLGYRCKSQVIDTLNSNIGKAKSYIFLDITLILQLKALLTTFISQPQSTGYDANSLIELTPPQWRVASLPHGSRSAGDNGQGTISADSHVWTSKELQMKNLVSRFVKDESGATAIEYGLIAAGISVAIIAVVQGLGSKLQTTFTSVQNALN